MKKVAIIQPNYIPWKGYFDIINYVDEFILLDDVQYTKNDWRNRNKIQGQNGVEWLTIPVNQNSLTQLINETSVQNPNWNIKHWKTIVQNYSNTSGFKEYGMLFEKLYKNINASNLVDINLEILNLILEILKIDTNIILSSTLNTKGNKSVKLVELCNEVGANCYVSSPKAKVYLDEQLFIENNMKVEWYHYDTNYSYPCYYNNFTPYISILDLIFNNGSKSSNFIK